MFSVRNCPRRSPADSRVPQYTGVAQQWRKATVSKLRLCQKNYTRADVSGVQESSSEWQLSTRYISIRQFHRSKTRKRKRKICLSMLVLQWLYMPFLKDRCMAIFASWTVYATNICQMRQSQACQAVCRRRDLYTMNIWADEQMINNKVRLRAKVEIRVLG